MNILDPISLPLTQSNLIEASAGTGKTYTMANLYLRLILGVGCEPLTAEQILVVTFTKAATQELRDRIRAKLGSVAAYFQTPDSDEAQQAFAQDPFLHQLYLATSAERAKSLLRLRIAERDMDLASIFTIDSFCQKMLFQYAFDSGVRFDLDLQTDESDLLKRLSEEVWREEFYPADLEKTTLVARTLRNPDYALSQVQTYLSDILPPLSAEQQQWLKADNQQKLADYLAFMAQAKQYWLAHQAEIVAMVADNLGKLNGNSYKADYLVKWQAELTAWAQDNTQDFITEPFNRFSQSFLESKTKKNQTVPTSEHFERIESFIRRFEAEFADLNKQVTMQLVYAYFEALREKLHQYKQSHTEKNFTDMLTYFHQALLGEKGEALADKIRRQFPFAMIDESQDTNQVQYDIFQRIFMHPDALCGFIMIGDPKQSIYKFRGADIFSYLNAAKQVSATFTLDKNWRSLPLIVEGVNRLFCFPTVEGNANASGEKSPFLYQDIAFNPVKYKESDTELAKGQHEWNLYLQPNAYKRGHFNTELAAEQCAHQIQQQLSRAQQGEAFITEMQIQQTEQGLQKMPHSRPLEAQDIAVLVRSHDEAQKIKRALAKRGIQSVYLSEQNSVYATQEAKDLALVLNACLHPYQQKAVLAALATPFWGLTAAELYLLKNSESEWEHNVENFIRYQQIWQTQGVLPMLHQLLLQQGIIQRLNGSENRDRRLTNLLHLSELLQAEQENRENELALLRWLQQQIEQPYGDTEQILRLESEEKLIKIITIHKSKGLEYPVVWLPFIAKKSLGATNELMSFYRDENHRLCWDFKGDDPAVKTLKDNAEYAEDLRLLYVALTRAKYQLNLILPTAFSSSWNAMHYLLTNGNIADKTDTAEVINAKGIVANMVPLAETVPAITRYVPVQEQNMVASAREFQGIIRTRGLMTSFSALQSQNERLQHFSTHSPLAVADNAKDHDRESFVAPTPLDSDEPTFTPADFPQGAKVGNLLHHFFEHWAFNQAPDFTQIESLCNALNLDPQWHEPLMTWFNTIAHTPFGDGFCLAELDTQKRLNEWQFCLRLRNEKALPQLNRLLKTESRLAKQLPDLQLKQLEGFVKGFVDMITEYNGKFYIIDYKSNYLGRFIEDYQAEKLDKTMVQQRYDLQYLLYTLALHRYLRTRLGEQYDYERDIGGVAYLFLRGMNGTPNSGVYFDKPNRTLIEEMDRLFG